MKILRGLSDYPGSAAVVLGAHINGLGIIRSWRGAMCPSCFWIMRPIPGLTHAMALEIIGPAAIEVRYDRRDDQYKYVETNFRYPRSGSMSLQAGVLVPLIHYYHITGQHDRLKGLRKVQQEDSGYYIEALREWMNVVENRPRGEHLLRVLKTYLVPKRTWAVWDWQDPRPGMVYGWRLAGKALHRLKSRF